MASKSNSRRNGIDGAEAVQRAREQLAQLISRPIEDVTGLERVDDGQGWRVNVQVVELSRIPSSTDVLGDYQIDLDRDGGVVGYRRTRRFYRSQADGG